MMDNEPHSGERGRERKRNKDENRSLLLLLAVMEKAASSTNQMTLCV